MNRMYTPVLLSASAFLAFLAGPAELRAETNTLPFYENFEAGSSWQIEWHALDAPANRYTDCPSLWILPHQSYCPIDPSNAPNIPANTPNDSWTYGPFKLEIWPDLANGGKIYSGQFAARQPIADPYWHAYYHIFTDPLNKELRLKSQVWDEASILCDCDPWGPPSRPNFDDNGGIELSAPYRRASYSGNDKEAFFLGVNSHQSWTHYCWFTVADGWVVTDLPRTHGWHQVEIVVRPYTGGLDVDFMLDGVRIAQAHRMAGPAGAGVPLTYVHLGGDPALLTETILSNTFEEFWYDEVALTACNNPRPDTNGDGAVDQSDFGVLQECITGPGDPSLRSNPLFDSANCQCLDIDGDQDVDQDDLNVFLACGSGPAVEADKDCDH